MKTRNILTGIIMLVASSTFMSCSTGRCPMSFASEYKAQPKTVSVEKCEAPVAIQVSGINTASN
jgi:hypothetical protein